MDWKEKAKHLKFTEHKSWNDVSRYIWAEYFMDEEYAKIHERVRGYLRALPEYKDVHDQYLKPVEPKIITNKWTGDTILRFALMGDTQFYHAIKDDYKNWE